MTERKKVCRKAFSILFISLLLSVIFLSVLAYAIEDPVGDKLIDEQNKNLGAEKIGEDTEIGAETASWCTLKPGEKIEDVGFFRERLCLWFWGYNAKTQKSLPAIVEIIKYFLLMIVFILIYSSLTYADFPEKAWLRFLLAAPTAFLATFFISQQEILAMMISYSALGVTFSVFLPIMILAFFTIAIAKKASPMGIYVQKIVWLIYSLYLFFKSGFGLLLSGIGNNTWLSGDKFWGMDIKSLKYYFIDKAGKTLVDPFMLLILFITAIAIFVIMVLGNKYVIDWFNKEAREAEIEGQKSMLERSHAYDALRAKEIQKETGKA